MVASWILNLQPYHTILVQNARRLAQEGHPEIAVVTALMACEVFVEQSLTALYRYKGVQYLEEAVERLLPSHNLNNDRVRCVYAALTDDDIQNAPFWCAFRQASTLRNALVHRGERATKEQANNACDAVQDLIQHVAQVVRTLSGT